MDPVDPSVKPGDSFYDYANNDWLSKTSIPAEKSRWTVFNVLDELSKTHLKALFEDLEKEPVGSSIVAELYSAGMDTATIDAKGLAPIQDLLNSVASLQSKQEIWKLVAKLSKQSFGSFFAFGVSPDAKNSTTAVFQFAQGGLGLPDRDFYELESKKEQREKYVLHIAKMNVLAGISQQDADSQAKLVYDFEVILAKHSLKMVERRDPVKTYNKKTVAELKTLSPQIDWDGFFGELGLSKLGSVVIESPAYFSELSKLVEISPIEQLKAYIKFRILTTAAPYISAPFVDEDFNFFKTILNGIPQNEPRWKRVLSQVSGSIQDPVSKMYVDKYFPPTAKKAASELVDFIILAFKESIQNAAWMEAETIEKALVKLSKFTVKIGYPDKWMDFTPLNGKISRKTSYLENIIIAHEYVFQKDVLGRVDKPVDKSKWEMAPFMVNACTLKT